MKIAILCPTSDFSPKYVLSQNFMPETLCQNSYAPTGLFLGFWGFFFENTKIILGKHFSWRIQETEHFIISVKRSQIGK